MWEGFEIGFWHPFGPYTGLSPTEVLEWKRGEAEKYGWTFWSFAHSSSAEWLAQLTSPAKRVFVFCSHSPSAKDPDAHRGTLLGTHYQYSGDDEWRVLPDPRDMKVTNPFKRKGLALAFKVGRVTPIVPTVPPFTIEWYSKQERRWRSDRLPTHGEFLIRRGGSLRPRPVSAILELVEPYLATLKCEFAPGRLSPRRGGDAATPRERLVEREGQGEGT